MQRRIERSYKQHEKDKQAHADFALKKRKDQINARYLTNSLGGVQDCEDAWVDLFTNVFRSETEEEALQSAQTRFEAIGGTPRHYMTPKILFRRQLGDQARVARRRPAASCPARRRHRVTNCVLGTMC